MPRALLAAVAAALLVLAAAACGPAGPNESKGPAADPVALLHVLPVPHGMSDGGPARAATAMDVLKATLERPPTEAEAARSQGAGLGASAIRTFAGPGGGEVTAVVSVWPSNLTAENFALQMVQRRVGKDGRKAWTPESLPASQGTRTDQGDRESILVRAVGPNALIVRSTGDVPGDAVERTMVLLVEAQEARG